MLQGPASVSQRPLPCLNYVCSCRPLDLPSPVVLVVVAVFVDAPLTLVVAARSQSQERGEFVVQKRQSLRAVADDRRHM